MCEVARPCANACTKRVHLGVFAGVHLCVFARARVSTERERESARARARARARERERERERELAPVASAVEQE